MTIGGPRKRPIERHRQDAQRTVSVVMGSSAAALQCGHAQGVSDDKDYT